MSFSRRVPASPLPCWEAFEEGRSQISSQTSSEGSDELEHEDETIVPSSPVQKRKTREDPSPVKTVKKPKLHSAPGDALNSRGRPAPRRRTLNINRDLPPVHGSGGTSSGSPLKSPTSTIPSTPSSNGQVNGRPRGGTPDSPDLTTVVSQVRKRPASQGSPLSATKSNQGKLNLPFFKHPGPVSASALSSKLIPTSSALKTPANKDQGKRPKSHTIPFPSTAPPAYRRRRSSLKIFARPSPLRTGSSPGPAHQGNDDDGSLDLTTPTPSPPPTRNFTQSGLETDPICIDSDDDGNANATPVKVKASSSGTLQYSPVVDLCSSEDEGPREEEEDEEGQPPVTFYRSPSPLAISPHLPTSSPEWEQNSAVDGVEPSMECEADLGAGTNVPAVSDQQDFLDEQNDGFKEGIPSMPVTVKRGMDYPEEAVVLDENQRAVPNHDIPTEDDSLPQDHSEYQSVGADWVLQTAADESTMKDEQSMLTVPDEEAMELSVIGTVYSVHEVHPESLRKSPVATAEAAVPAIQDDESPCQIYVSPSIPSGNTSAGLTGQDAEMSSHATSSPSVSSPSSLVNQRGKVVFKGSKYSRETGYLARAFRQLPSPSEPTTGNSCVRVSPTSQSALDNEPNEPFDIRRASTTSTAQQVAQTPHSSASAPSDASEERVEDLLEPASSQPEASESADLETPVTTAADNNTAEDLPHVSDALENDFSLVTDMSAMRLPFVTALSSYIENGKEVYDLTWDTDTEGVSDSEEAMASAMQLTDILPNYRSDFPGNDEDNDPFRFSQELPFVTGIKASYDGPRVVSRPITPEEMFGLRDHILGSIPQTTPLSAGDVVDTAGDDAASPPGSPSWGESASSSNVPFPSRRPPDVIGTEEIANPEPFSPIPGQLIDMLAGSTAADNPDDFRSESPVVVARKSRRVLSRSSSASSWLSDPMDIAHPPDISYATQGSSRDSSLVTETEDISSGIRGISLETWASPGPSSPQDYYQAKDMPHLLQDHINSLPPSYLKSDFVREIFEAHISESTAEDEPDAPQIRIYNPIEGDDETSPPWEFHYSNHMWHGEGVPAPEYSKVRCSCKGPCDPKSKTCACLRRQEGYTRDAEGAKGFMYDNKGRLNMKLMQYPIFECNDLCSCSDECRNRVVQHGRKCSINIVKTKEKGWGVFAGEKPIPEGTYLGIYSGELLSDAEGEERGLKYNKFGRTYLFNIDWWYLQRDEPEIKYVVDAYHIGNFTRFLNHSCAPNCCLVPCYVNEGNLEKPLFTVFTLHDVQPYEELCFSYRGLDDDSDDEHQSAPNQTDAIYVPCRCGAATCKGKMFL